MDTGNTLLLAWAGSALYLNIRFAKTKEDIFLIASFIPVINIVFTAIDLFDVLGGSVYDACDELRKRKQEEEDREDRK